MTVSKTAAVDSAKASRTARKRLTTGQQRRRLQLANCPSIWATRLKRAQLKILTISALRRAAAADAAQSRWLLLPRQESGPTDRIANTLGILSRICAMLDGLESRGVHAVTLGQ